MCDSIICVQMYNLYFQANLQFNVGIPKIIEFDPLVCVIIHFATWILETRIQAFLIWMSDVQVMRIMVSFLWIVSLWTTEFIVEEQNLILIWEFWVSLQLGTLLTSASFLAVISLYKNLDHASWCVIFPVIPFIWICISCRIWTTCSGRVGRGNNKACTLYGISYVTIFNLYCPYGILNFLKMSKKIIF
jgi:hypothetical protein